MKKLYISGKITGVENYKELFDEAEKYYTGLGYIVMNPAILPEGFEWDDYMPICLEMLKPCDVFALLEGWQNSPGAKCELKLALEDNKKIVLYQGVIR